MREPLPVSARDAVSRLRRYVIGIYRIVCVALGLVLLFLVDDHHSVLDESSPEARMVGGVMVVVLILVGLLPRPPKER